MPYPEGFNPDMGDVNLGRPKQETLQPRKGPGFTVEDVIEMFTYHPPKDEETIRKYQAIREAGQFLAVTIMQHAPSCATTTSAIRMVWEACMKANGAIATEGKF